MENYLGIAWLIATVIAWLSFGEASWFRVDDFDQPGLLALTVLWFVISLALFRVGVRLRKSS